MRIATSTIIKNLIILFLVFAGLYYAKSFLIPLSIAGLLATLLLPFCKWLEGKKVPRFLSAFIPLMTILLAIAFVVMLVGWQISALVDDFDLVKQKTITFIADFQDYIFDQLGITLQKQGELISNEQFSFAGILKTAAGSVSHFLANLILVLAYIFLLLYYRVHIKRFLLKLSPPAQTKEMEQVVKSVATVSQQYLVGLSKMIFCLWIMYGIGFTVLGVKNALFFAIFCGLCEIVPFIGNITGSTLTILVSAVQGAHFPMLFGIAVTYAIVQFIQGWVLEPIILGPQVKINPFATIIALVVGNLIWGIPGIFLAIPLTAMLKIACDHIESLKPFGFLIGEIESTKKPFAWFRSRQTHKH